MDIPRHFSGNMIYAANLFSGIAPRTGEAANLTLRVIRLEDDKAFNFVAHTWDAMPSTWTNYGAAVSILDANLNYVYRLSDGLTNAGGTWARGHYQAIMHDISGEEWLEEFTVGLFQERRMGNSCVYDGTNLNMTLWMEEAGVFQSDYTQLTSAQILSPGGTQLLSLGTIAGSSGIFTVTNQAVALTATTNYTLAANAVMPVAGGTTISFPMRLGLVRP